MNRSNVILEMLYEIKCTRRNILFNIFVLLALLGIIFLPFILFPVGTKTRFGQVNLPWYAQALSSSIPFMIAYYYNFVQFLLVIFMTSNDLRRAGLTAMSALDVRSQYNIDVIVGRFLGRIIVFSCVNVLVFLIAMCYNLFYYPQVFNPVYYLFYWLTLTFPVLIYFLGLSILITRCINNQGISVLVLLALGSVTWYRAEVMNNILDPLARYTPNLFSDFVGHACLYSYLLHRVIYLFAGIFLLILSVLTCQRLHNDIHPIRKNILISGIPFIVLVILLLLYFSHFNKIERNEDRYRQIYLTYDTTLKANVLTNNIVLRETDDGGFMAESKMRVVNGNQKTISLILYLNPGLQINKLECDSRPLLFERNGQVVIVDKLLEFGDTCNLTLVYNGKIDNAICNLDITVFDRNFLGMNRLGIFHFGEQPAYCFKEYKFFTPECLWYPVSVPPVRFSVFRNINFTRYSLKVIHDERCMVISQGKTNRGKGETNFAHEYDLQGISLCLGKYQKRTLLVDSVQMELYYLPSHESFLQCFAEDTNQIKEELADLKYQWELEESVQQEHFFWERVFAKQERKSLPKDPAQEYPYKWLRLIEVPESFRAYLKNDEMDGENSQCGLFFLPEKLCTKFYDPLIYKARKPFPEFRKLIGFQEFIVENFKQGSCSILPTLKGQLGYVSSNDYPMIYNILLYLGRGLNNKINPIDEYNATRYMVNHSLLHAIKDSCLSPQELNVIIKNKSKELFAFICAQVPKRDFMKFYYDFMNVNRFQNVDFRLFINNFRHTFDVDIEDILKRWYERDKLPVLRIESKCYVDMSTEIDGKAQHYYSCKVFNKSDEDGLLVFNNDNFLIIPKRKCLDVSCKILKRIYSKAYYEIPMAKNVPSRKNVDKERIQTSIDVPTGVFDMDSIYFSSKNEDVIVDVFDPQCKIVSSKTWLQSMLMLFKKQAKLERKNSMYYSAWSLDINSKYYGFPVQGAYRKTNGVGGNYVEWNISLEQNGEYELFVYNVPPLDNKILYDNTLYFSIDDGSLKSDVKVDVSNESDKWALIGKYNVTNNTLKIIQYDKQDLLMSFKVEDIVVVNAIRLKLGKGNL